MTTFASRAKRTFFYTIIPIATLLVLVPTVFLSFQGSPNQNLWTIMVAGSILIVTIRTSEIATVRGLMAELLPQIRGTDAAFGSLNDRLRTFEGRLAAIEGRVSVAEEMKQRVEAVEERTSTFGRQLAEVRAQVTRPRT